MRGGATSTFGYELGLWRAIEVFRGLALVYAAAMVWLHQGSMTRPWVAWGTLGALALWSLFVTVSRARSGGYVLAELALVCGGILLTRVVHPAADIEAGATTIPAMFSSAAPAAAAVVGGLRGGLLAATVVTAANLVEVRHPTSATIYNTLLLYLSISCVGLSIELSRRGQAALEEAVRLRAEAEERERLSRVVHDGVLQTLAYVHRRGRQLGGPAAELGELAARSERELRLLATSGRSATSTSATGGSVDLRRPVGGVHGRPAGADPGSTVDVREELLALTRERVEVAAPAGPVPVEREAGTELVAAVRACLDNVAQHAGPTARAWVLLEDVGDAVEVTVRDDGTGIPEGRLDEAEAEGRLGVASCIRGRLEDLGGEVTYRGGAGRGTVVHLRLPVRRGRIGT